MPELFNGTLEKLKTKWTMHKKSKWTNMVIIKNTNYSKELLQDLYEWLANLVNIKINYDEVTRLANKKLFRLLENKEGMFEILGDPSYFNEWNKRCQKSGCQ